MPIETCVPPIGPQPSTIETSEPAPPFASGVSAFFVTRPSSNATRPTWSPAICCFSISRITLRSAFFAFGMREPCDIEPETSCTITTWRRPRNATASWSSFTLGTPTIGPKRSGTSKPVIFAWRAGTWSGWR